MTNLLSQLPHRKITSFLDAERNWEFLRNGLEVDGATITIGTQVIQNINIEDHTIGHDQLSFDAIDAMTITGTTIRTAAPPAARVEMDSLGIRGINAGGVEKFEFDVTSGILTASAVISTETGSVIDTDHLAGQITETQIADDSISTPKLQANSVTANEIDVADLSAISADLGTITAGLITGGEFRTSNSAARVVMDSSGLYSTQTGTTTNVKDVHLTTSGLKLITGATSTPADERKISWLTSTNVRAFFATYDDGTDIYLQAKVYNSSNALRGNFQLGNSTSPSGSSWALNVNSPDNSFLSGIQGSATNSVAEVDAVVTGYTKKIIKSDGTSDYLFKEAAFEAYHAHASGSYNDSSTIVFGTEVSDLGGNNYNTSTGVFTAPIAGIYHFSWGVYRNGAPAANKYWQSYITTSGGVLRFGELNITDGANLPYSAGSSDLKLAASETVQVKIGTNIGAGNAIYGTSQATYFTGHYVRPSS